nr:MAG TPA: hypothetical protein [Caudoviricetes sp.]
MGLSLRVHIGRENKILVRGVEYRALAVSPSFTLIENGVPVVLIYHNFSVIEILRLISGVYDLIPDRVSQL